MSKDDNVNKFLKNLETKTFKGVDVDKMRTQSPVQRSAPFLARTQSLRKKEKKTAVETKPEKSQEKPSQNSQALWDDTSYIKWRTLTKEESLRLSVVKEREKEEKDENEAKYDEENASDGEKEWNTLTAADIKKYEEVSKERKDKDIEPEKEKEVVVIDNLVIEKNQPDEESEVISVQVGSRRRRRPKKINKDGDIVLPSKEEEEVLKKKKEISQLWSTMAKDEDNLNLNLAPMSDIEQLKAEQNQMIDQIKKEEDFIKEIEKVTQKEKEKEKKPAFDRSSSLDIFKKKQAEKKVIEDKRVKDIEKTKKEQLDKLRQGIPMKSPRGVTSGCTPKITNAPQHNSPKPKQLPAKPSPTKPSPIPTAVPVTAAITTALLTQSQTKSTPLSQTVPAKPKPKPLVESIESDEEYDSESDDNDVSTPMAASDQKDSTRNRWICTLCTFENCDTGECAMCGTKKIASNDEIKEQKLKQGSRMDISRMNSGTPILAPEDSYEKPANLFGPETWESESVPIENEVENSKIDEDTVVVVTKKDEKNDFENFENIPSVFNCACISDLLAIEQQNRPDWDARIPYILVILKNKLMELKCLETEGIFRMSCSTTERDKIREKVLKLNYSIDTQDVHVPASLFKEVLRSLGDGLFPALFFKDCLQIASANLGKQETRASDLLKNLFVQLPPLNRRVIRFLVEFLSEIIKNEKKTKMSVNGLAPIFAPVLLRADPTRGLDTIMSQSVLENSFVSTLLKYLPPPNTDEDSIEVSTVTRPASDSVAMILSRPAIRSSRKLPTTNRQKSRVKIPQSPTHSSDVAKASAMRLPDVSVEEITVDHKIIFYIGPVTTEDKKHTIAHCYMLLLFDTIQLYENPQCNSRRPIFSIPLSNGWVEREEDSVLLEVPKFKTRHLKLTPEGQGRKMKILQLILALKNRVMELRYRAFCNESSVSADARLVDHVRLNPNQEPADLDLRGGPFNVPAQFILMVLLTHPPINVRATCGIRDLSLANCRLGISKGFRKFIQGAPQWNMTSLNLSGNSIINALFILLKNLSTCVPLKVIKLNNCRLGDNGLKTLAPVLGPLVTKKPKNNMCCLNELYIEGNNISGAGLRFLAKSPDTDGKGVNYGGKLNILGLRGNKLKPLSDALNVALSKYGWEIDRVIVGPAPQRKRSPSPNQIRSISPNERLPPGR